MRRRNAESRERLIDRIFRSLAFNQRTKRGWRGGFGFNAFFRHDTRDAGGFIMGDRFDLRSACARSEIFFADGGKADVRGRIGATFRQSAGG